ncbi:MAG: hypothetical protein LC772_06725 [Chloroflexi bacterium]|nr:hypothetical protein [Chloroflexota bacterium]
MKRAPAVLPAVLPVAEGLTRFYCECGRTIDTEDHSDWPAWSVACVHCSDRLKRMSKTPPVSLFPEATE